MPNDYKICDAFLSRLCLAGEFELFTKPSKSDFLLFFIQRFPDFFRNLAYTDRLYDRVPNIRKPGIIFHSYLDVRPLKNAHFCLSSRAILQDSRIGYLSSCPQGRGAWTPRVNTKILTTQRNRLRIPRGRRRYWRKRQFSFRHYLRVRCHGLKYS